jgi:hypothetical protein
MSEPNEMGCSEFTDVAAELALGVLTGRERAEATAHLEHCDACRENVRQLTMTGEGLLGLLPDVEPPPGFEAGVMDRLGLAGPAPSPAGWLSRVSPSRRKPARQGAPGRKNQVSLTRRMLATAAVVVAVAAAGLGGWSLGTGGSAPARTPLNSAALLSASHQTVGKIFFYAGGPRWVYMSADLPTGNGTVTCQVQSRDGHITTVGSFQLTDGHGYWGSPVPGTQGSLTRARLVSPDGTVLATASFPQ